MQSLLEVISTNVKFYRKKSGLSQLKLAYQLDMAPSYLAEIERGKQYPSLKVVEKIADYFEILPYQLLQPLELTDIEKNQIETNQIIRVLKKQIDNIFDEQLFSNLDEK